MTVPAKNLESMNVLMGGKIVYQREDFRPSDLYG